MGDIMTTNGTQSAIQRASDFASRLYSGAMTAEDERALEVWLAEHPSHQAEYQAVLDTWYNMGELAEDNDVLAYAQEPADALDRPVWPKLAMAAGVVLAAVVGLFSFNFSEPELMRYVTAVGEQKTVTLSDGTAMTLNTNTQVLVDYTDGYRRAILDRGEAFFEVAKDASRPFGVDIGAHKVTVLGTSFNVYKTPLALQVAVTEGMVVLHRKEDDLGSNKVPNEGALLKKQGLYLLKPGYLLSFDDQSGVEPVLTHDMSQVANNSNWRHGSIRFDKVPLSQVVGELNRYSRKKILVEDHDVMDIDVSAVVHLDDLSGALDGLERGLPLQITYYSDRIVVTGK